MDARLGGLRYSRATREALPDPDAAFKTRVLRPLIAGMNRRANRILPSSISERLESAITQAGLRIKPGHFIIAVAILAGLLPLLVLAFLASSGSSPKMMLLFYGVLVGFGIYGPRIWLMGRIKRRQKQIWKSLPDAFDLITASVEAGLGIDAAFNRVLDKVTGPFAEELGRTMRE